ncbi:MAG: hypothetical protein ACJKTH_03395 [Patescibacteria group bacterium UBA2163]
MTENKCTHCNKKHTCERGGLMGGGAWLTGWLFTIGFLQLTVLKGLLALLLWPYYLGVHFGI